MDVLSKIFKKEKTVNVLKGLSPNYFHNTTITNYHYADDTILFLEANYVG